MLDNLANAIGLNGTALFDTANAPEAMDVFLKSSDATIEANIFGAPTWVVDGERFKG